MTYHAKNIHTARTLRKNLTPHESILWFHLRSRRFQGYKFRRQYPCGVYFADFCCLEKRLIIELDGGQHNEQLVYDYARDKYLGSRLADYRLLT